MCSVWDPSFLAKDWTHIPGIEPTSLALKSQSPNHWAAREVPFSAIDF